MRGEGRQPCNLIPRQIRAVVSIRLETIPERSPNFQTCFEGDYWTDGSPERVVDLLKSMRDDSIPMTVFDNDTKIATRTWNFTLLNDHKINTIDWALRTADERTRMNIRTKTKSFLTTLDAMAEGLFTYGGATWIDEAGNIPYTRGNITDLEKLADQDIITDYAVSSFRKSLEAVLSEEKKAWNITLPVNTTIIRALYGRGNAVGRNTFSQEA